MIFVLDILITLLLVFFESLLIFFFFRKFKTLDHFFVLLKVNTLFKFQYYFAFIFIFLIIVIEFFFVLNIYNTYLPSFKIFINDIINIFNNTACCAGIPKLIESCNYINDYDRSEFSKYQNNTYMKTIYKYNFNFLERKTSFFSNRNTIQELGKICSELNAVHNNSINAYREIFEKKSLNQDISKLLEENLFKIENLRLLNKKLGIPLYKSLYNETLTSEKILPLILYKKFDINITLNHICPFLFGNKITKDINYFNVELSIVLGEEKKDSLIILKQTKTINARDSQGRVFNDYLVQNQIIKKKQVISEIFVKDTNNINKKLEVIDLTVRSERPNGATQENILEGGVGIVESYVHYTKCMSKTITLLDSLNKNLNIENIQLQNLNNIDFLDFYESRIINKCLIYNSEEFFNRLEPISETNISLKFKKINNIFLNQLKEDTYMLRDIHQGQSNMLVNYEKLNQIMQDPNPEVQKYFDSKTRDRISRAAEGNFSLIKKPRRY